MYTQVISEQDFTTGKIRHRYKQNFRGDKMEYFSDHNNVLSQSKRDYA